MFFDNKKPILAKKQYFMMKKCTDSQFVANKKIPPEGGIFLKYHSYLSSRKYARPRLAGGRLLFFLRKIIMIRTATVAR